jgi:hypothetical protein
MLELRLRRACALTCGIALWIGIAPAQADQPDADFHEAYYLEVEKGDIAAAAKLYESVVESPKSSGELRDRARQRLAGCREEIAAGDFAKLMPPDALAYVELSRPGSQVERLLDMLGLLANSSDASRKRSTEGTGRRVAVSPTLVRELLGIRGAAVALTGVDLVKQMPAGVGVIHPGRLDVFRGLLETGLPAAAQIVDPIRGLPTYLVEHKVVVCLTQRLVVFGTDRQHVEGVVARLQGDARDSLADSPNMADGLADRADALLFFCVNAQRIMPLVIMAAQADRDFAMAAALLDLRTVQWLTGRVGVSPRGLFADVALRLEKGHHNIAYNLVRTPPIRRETLAQVPEGVAGVFAAALSEKTGGASAASESAGRPAVTGLDVGREIFANIQDFAVYVLPPQTDGRSEQAGDRLPDVAALVRVRDAARSEALWTEILGIASLCAGAPGREGRAFDLEGVPVREYTFPGGVCVNVGFSGDRMIMSLTRAAMRAALAGGKEKGSLLEDQAFAAGLEQVTAGTSKVVMVHPGRMLEVARPFMSGRDYQEAEEVARMMPQLVATVMTQEREEELQAAVRVSGLPKVDRLLSELLDREIQRETRASAQADQWRRFEHLSREDGNPQEAKVTLEALLEDHHNDADRLNNIAWALLTEDGYGDDYLAIATRLAVRACELTDNGHWAYLDTLALAHFKAHDVEGALRLQRRAVELQPDRPDLRQALQRYESAAGGAR